MIQSNEPYITVTRIEYNPDYGDDRICVCSHTYYRHFDSYDNHAPIGCKYCSDCWTFIEESTTPEAELARLRLANSKLREAVEILIDACRPKFGVFDVEDKIRYAEQVLEKGVNN